MSRRDAGHFAGYDAAVAATRERALAWIGERREPPDRDAVDHVVATLEEPGADGVRAAGFLAALDRVGADDVGERAVALLVVEHQLALRAAGGDVDLDAFAAALTAFAVAAHRTSTGIVGRRRVVRALRRFLHQPDEVLLAISPRLTDRQRTDWEDLARLAPWVRWLAPEELDPPAGHPVGPAEIVDLLVLLRPRQVQRYAHDRVTTGPVPARFLRLYRPGRGDLDGVDLDELAEALGPLPHDPARAARAVQTLRPPGPLGAAVQERLRRERRHVAREEHLLALRVDDAASARVLLVNLSREHPLQLRLDDVPVTVRENAVELRGAVDYCSPPLPTHPHGSVALGRRKVSLDVPRAPLAERSDVTSAALPPGLFRGREEQLARLREAMSGRGPRTGSLIFGTRRAGKSTLMDHVCQDEGLRAAVALDLSDTSRSVRDYADWSAQVCRNLARRLRRVLPEVTLDLTGGDLVDALVDLDDELDGGPPVAVAIDELDMLLLPEQGSGGRRAAGRLGNKTFRNLVVMGTVQRFHRSVHEFKNWRMIECPADLGWADGVSYFLGPLADALPGPRVEWLTRAGVTPTLFTEEIAPVVGLRPYFWAQLRSHLEAVVRADGAGSRLVGADVLRAKLAHLVTHDLHLSLVLDDGAHGLEPEECRRRDLFGVEERRILLRFARMRDGEDKLAVEEAERIGGQAAVRELVDRAYLVHNASRTRLRTAVPIYHRFLRSRATDLAEITPEEPAAGRRSVTRGAAAAPVPATPPAPPPPDPAPRPTPTAADPDGLDRLRSALLAALRVTDPLPLTDVGQIIRRDIPELHRTRYAGTRRLTVFLDRFLPEFPRTEVAEGVFVLSAPRPPSGPHPAGVARVHAAVLDALAETDALSLGTVANVIIRSGAPEIGPPTWAGAGKMTTFIERFLPGVDVRELVPGERFVCRAAAPR